VALLSLTTFVTPAAPPISAIRARPTSAKLAIYHRVSLSEIFVFSLSFSSFSLSSSYADFCFSFHCRPNGCHSSSLSKSRISRASALSQRLFYRSRVREIVAMRIGYVVLATRRVQRRLILRQPLTNRFSKCEFPDCKTDPEICNSKGSAFIVRFNKPPPFTAADICRNSLSMMVDRQNAFDGMVNYNVSDLDGTVESSNPPLYAPEACPIDSERNDRTLAAEVSVYTVTIQQLNREYQRDSRRKIFATKRFAVLHACK